MKDTSMYFVDERPLEARRSHIVSCNECGALIIIENQRDHLDWHKSLLKTIELLVLDAGRY